MTSMTITRHSTGVAKHGTNTNNMAINIGDFAKKKMWERRLPQTRNTGGAVSAMSNPAVPFRFDTYPRRLMSQSDFLGELAPSAHSIYDIHYRSDRPMYKYNEAKQKNEFAGYDRVERVAVALQAAIRRHKTTHCFGNPVWIGNEGDNSQSQFVANIKSYWNTTGMNNGIMQFGSSCFGTGDGALYIYREPGTNELRYKTFSFEAGDIVTEFKNPEDNYKRNVIRMFQENGVPAVEIYTSTRVKKWLSDNAADVSGFKRTAQKLTGKRSEDNYVLVSDVLHGLTQCPVAYHRENDVCWGDVQGNIEDIEKLLSDLMENGKYYNFQILFTSGIVAGLPNVNFQGKVIAAKTKDGDAKILQPADASNTFTLSLDNAFNMMCDGIGAVFIRPEELKGGDYSGAFLRNLYFPEAQWCVEAYARFDPAIKQIISIFKDWVGILENDKLGYHKLKLSYVCTPFIPSNDFEEVNIINYSVAAGTMSRETAAEEHPRANPNEVTRLEADDKRRMEAEKEPDPPTEETVE